MVQKAERFAAMGIANPFTQAGVMDFLRAGAMPTAQGEPPLVWHALLLDGRIISTTIGAVDGARFAGMASSFLAEPEIMKHSAGELLLTDIIADEARRGRRVFDLGVGESPLQDHLLRYRRADGGNGAAGQPGAVMAFSPRCKCTGWPSRQGFPSSAATRRLRGSPGGCSARMMAASAIHQRTISRHARVCGCGAAPPRPVRQQ